MLVVSMDSPLHSEATPVFAHAPLFADAIDRLPIASAFKRFVIPPKITRLYRACEAAASPVQFAATVLRGLDVHYEVSEADVARIPRTGPVILVANHPFGILEGFILVDMLSRVRSDVRILANSLLASVPEMRAALICVDPFEQASSVSSNRKGVREALSFLAAGGLLVVFPAGEVSHLQIRERRIADPRWNQNVARFIRHSKAVVVPLFVKGSNSATFQIIGMMHAQLRTARLLHELANKERKTVELRIGHPIRFDPLSKVTDAELTQYLRYRTYLMKNRKPHGLGWRPAVRRSIAAAADPALIEAEVTRLTPLAESADLAVYLAAAGQIPAALHEIGRLREVTFRAAGEGTGRAIDLDRFDPHYRHLFVWDRAARSIAGAYRLGFTSELLPRFGIGGLYISTLFRFEPGFFERVGPAIELGRSFVAPEYQKQFAPLMLLWKGIGAHIAAHPENPILFGPVSISNEYHPLSRSLIVDFLQRQKSIDDLAPLVEPRQRLPKHRRGADDELVKRMLHDIDDLSAVTGDIEPDGKGVPVLLRQYLKLGGKLLGFNVDRAFSNALDGLILVDLRETPAAISSRYLGRDGLRRFLSHHRVLSYHRRANATAAASTV